MSTCRLVLPLALSLAVLPLPLRAQKAEAKRAPVDDRSQPGYIPRDLEDALDELDRTIDPKEKERIRSGNEEAVMHHHGLGMGLRNGWGLWAGSRLALWFNGKGVHHPDDMSGIILDAWFCRLRGKHFDLEGEIRGYQEFWKQAEERAKQEEAQAEASRKRIPGLMMGLEMPPRPSQWATLPVRKTYAGRRVRYMAAYGKGYLITSRETRLAPGGRQEIHHTAPYFYNPASRTLGPLRCPEFERIENAVVIAGTLYLEGVKGEKHSVLALAPGRRAAIPLPPGTGWVRLGIRGDRLLAVFPRSIWEWDGQSWQSIGQPAEDLPWCGMPPVVRGDCLYLRDEGEGGDDKSLRWVKLPCRDKLTVFHEDTGLVGSRGPRWTFVWSWVFAPGGAQWIVTGGSTSGRSLVQRDAKGQYHIALMHGESVFSGDLSGSRAKDRIDVAGLFQGEDGALLLAGNTGLYRLEGRHLTPIVGLRRTRQWVPSRGEPAREDLNDPHGNWTLDPSHILPVGPQAYLLGSEWQGVYLVEGKGDGTWGVTCLDEPFSAPVTF